MYLINTTTLELRSFLSRIPYYVILSHTWGDDEVSFESMQNPDTLKKSSYGYRKIKRCCEQAKKDGYEWAWVDTCCIDKRSSAELSEAINSMYRYYWEADKCYAYLADVRVKYEPNMWSMWTSSYSKQSQKQAENSPETFDGRSDLSEAWFHWGRPHQTSFSGPEDVARRLKGSRWFRRGWTLQELLAPAAVEFYDANWILLGTKSNLATEIGRITDINVRYLHDRTSIKTASLGLRLSWASKRRTTRDEDIAYCLLGLVGVNMPLLYGEGKRAFRRLQVELLKQTRDHTMFLWSTNENSGGWPTRELSLRGLQGFLAPSPEYFQASDLENIRPTFLQPLVENSALEMTALGLHITLPCIPGWTQKHIIAILDCSKEDNTLIGVILVELDDGRYRRSRYSRLQTLSSEDIKRAVTKGLYILDEALEEREDMGRPSCAFKVCSLTMEGISESDVRGYMTCSFDLRENTDPNEPELITNARLFRHRAVKLAPGGAVVFIIKLCSVDIAVLCGELNGHCWVRAVLLDNESVWKDTTELVYKFLHRPPSEHLRDSVAVSRGTELCVDVHAQRRLLDQKDYVVPGWELYIHIRAGSAMPLR